MFPLVIDLGTFDLPWLGPTHLFLPTYGLLFATGVILAWRWFSRRAAGMGLPDEPVFGLVFYSLVAGIVGAKLGLVLVDWRTYLERPAALLGTVRAAGVLVAGVVAAAVVFVVYSRRHRLPTLELGDAAAAPLALAQAVGRLGCFSAGCCWGVEASADSAFAITFTDPRAHEITGCPLHVPLVPVQLLQLAHDLALALLLTWLWRRRLEPPGTVFWWYVLLYGIGRSTLELWRGDVERGLFLDGRVSTTQLFGGVAVALAVAMLLRGRWRPRGRRLGAERA